MRNGSGVRRFYLVRLAIPAGQGRTIAGFSKPCSGSRGSGLPGGTSRRCSGTGTRPSSASGAGWRRTSLPACSGSCPETRISSTRWLTAPSSASTSMGQVPRGGTSRQAIGRSRGGLTTKIVALVDGLGNLARFVLLPGQRHDTLGTAALIAGIEIGALIGDKGFDNDWLRQELDTRGATAVTFGSKVLSPNNRID